MKFLKSLFINILVLSFICTPVLAGQTHYGGVLPAHSIDFRQGTAATRGFPGTPTTTLDRNDGQEYNYDGDSLELLVDNEVRIHSTNGAGFEPAVANLLPFKDLDTNWSVNAGVNYQRGGTTYWRLIYGGTGASTNTLDEDSVRSAASARSIKTAITDAGGAVGDIRFISDNSNMPLFLTAGTAYIVSFYAKASGAKTIPITLVNSGVGDQNISVTTTWQKFEVLVSAISTTTTAYIAVKLGDNGLYDFYIDAISFEEASFASSRWIGGDAAVGADVVVNGDFAATSEGAELSSGNLTIGKTYKITARTGEDFTADGSPNNNVGTYFQATGTNVTLDADDKVVPITIDTWDDTADGLSAGTDGAGALNGKASWDGSQGASSSLIQTALFTMGVNIYRGSITVTRSAGSIIFSIGSGGDITINSSGTYYIYGIPAFTSLSITADSAFIGTVDDVSAQEHGSVGVTESAKLTYTLPTSPIGGALFAETLGAEISSGTLTLGLSYNITADTGGDFYAGSAVGEYFVSDGTETADGNSKVKNVTNAYNSGTGLLPPHATFIAEVRFGYAESDVPNSTSSGIINVQDATVGFLYGRIDGSGTASVNSQDDSFNTPKKAYNWAADTLYKIVVQYGYLTSNVLQMRIGVDTGSGISWGSAVTYSGTYTTGTDLILAHTPFGPIDIQQLMIFSEILDDTIIDGLGF